MGVIFGFAKNVKALLGPVVNLGRGQNCEKKSEKLHKPTLYDEKCVQKLIFKKRFLDPFPNFFLNRGHHSNREVFPFPKMVLNLIVAKKFTELLLFEVRCKKRDGAAGAGAGSTLYLLWIKMFAA